MKKFYSIFRELLSLARDLAAVAFFPFSFLAILSATVEYDPETERLASELLKNSQELFIKLKEQDSTSCSYEKNTEYYQKIERDIGLLGVRVGVIPNNSVTENQVATLTDALQDLKMLHNDYQKRCIKKDDITSINSSFNWIYGTILEQELQKKPLTWARLFSRFQQSKQTEE